MKTFTQCVIALLLIAGSNVSIAQEARAKKQNLFIEEDEPVIAIKSLAKDQQAAKEKELVSLQTKSAHTQSAPKTLGIVLEIPVVQPIWTLTVGRTIGQELKSWGEKANWTIVWNPTKDWSVPANATFAGDFVTAATEVMNTLASNGALVRAHFYELNRTMVITGPGVAEQ